MRIRAGGNEYWGKENQGYPDSSIFLSQIFFSSAPHLIRVIRSIRGSFAYPFFIEIYYFSVGAHL